MSLFRATICVLLAILVTSILLLGWAVIDVANEVDRQGQLMVELLTTPQNEVNP